MFSNYFVQLFLINQKESVGSGDCRLLNMPNIVQGHRKQSLTGEAIAITRDVIMIIHLLAICLTCCFVWVAYPLLKRWCLT